MIRRDFLKGLLGVAAVAMARPAFKILPAAPPALFPTTVCSTELVDNFKARTPYLRMIDGYSDYVQFSDLAMNAKIDRQIETAARELAYRAAITVNTLYGNLYVEQTLKDQGLKFDHRKLAHVRRDIRRIRYMAKQRRRAVRMAA